MGTFRYSALKTFTQCPAKFKKQYIERIDNGIESSEAFTGRIVHAALQWLYGEHKTQPTAHGLKLKFDNLFDKQCHEKIRSVDGKPKQLYRLLGYECLNNFWTKYAYKHGEAPFSNNIHESTIGTEYPVLFELGNHTITGTIDRLYSADDSSVMVIQDYKTGSSVPTSDQFDADIQLTTYQLGLMAVEPSWGKPNYSQQWDYLRHGKTITRTRTHEEIERTKSELLTILDDIDEADDMNHYPYRVSYICPYCPYSDDCSAWQEYQAQQEHIA